MRFSLFLLLISCTLQAQETPVQPVESPPEPGYSFTEGQIGGESLRIESSRTEGTTLSTGSLGTKPVNTFTVRLDNVEITTGTVGNESIEVITIVPEHD